MSTSPINGLSSSYLQSVFGSILQKTGSTTRTANHSLSGTDGASFASQPDSGRLSPFAQIMSGLQKLQQTDPTKYQQVTQQIATNLQSAAKTAQVDGDTAAANQLNQLATDFTNASTSGQMPDVQDLAQALSGHHHHRQAAQADSATSSASNTAAGSTSSASNSSSDQALLQLLSAYQANATNATANSLNPMSIIQDVLTSAGIGATTS
jgi:hypothetical protein